MMEDIHSQQYQLLIETFVNDKVKKLNLLQSTLEIPSIRAKAEWARRWIREASFVQRLIAFSIVEGIFFSASFCSIFWVKKRGLMPGLANSNLFISRDEAMHRDLAILIYNRHIKYKLDNQVIKDMIQDSVKVEETFVNDCLPYQLQGMNKNLMNQYVRFVANRLCVDLIGESLYEDDNPFSWMNLISMEGKTNFFEKRVTNYARQAALVDKNENKISFDEDF